MTIECRCESANCLPCNVRRYPGETMGERIGQARRLRGWSHDALAARLRRRRSRATNIYRWERDEARPQRPTLFALARTLGVTVRWLECRQ
jgi:ribosome-binding protein aMBF1 (putative translation factor)